MKKPNTKNCHEVVEEHRISSPVGIFLVKSCHKGLHYNGLDGKVTDENFTPNNRTHVGLLGEVSTKNIPTPVIETLSWMQAYFENPAQVQHLPIPNVCALEDKQGSFTVQVWKELAKVPVGEIVTYGQLANKLNNPGAVRAVGSAMKNNPVCLVLPCHRVVRANGMGNYHGGTRNSMKAWLLHHEGITKFQ
ncbi:O-6-alkylguanine-DNA alkyltransferase isoform X2 [Oratosquilla oratoria]